jgi:hypothetical protein
MDSVYVMLSCLLVAGLLTWRLLTGSRHELRHERRVVSSGAPLLDASGDADDETYRAVTLRVCPRPCGAALLLRQQVFLVDEAPALPLPECNRTCGCSYLPRPDRRADKDRRYPEDGYVRVRTAYAVPEQRAGRDRRRKGRFQYTGIY